MKPLDHAVLRQALALRHRGWTWDALARELHIDVVRLRTAIEPSYQRSHDGRWSSERPMTMDAIDAAARRPAEDARSLTARMFGDPLPGRSALDRRRTAI